MVETLDRQLFNEAKKYIPGGVNSPIRSFGAVGGYPVFVNYGQGSKIYDECGSEFIDYCMAFGALILGHANPKVKEALKKAVVKGTIFGTPTKQETELAKLIIKAISSIEKLRLTNSGTEAVMGAIRLARAFTKKDKIIKFEGSYHGHADYLLNCPGVSKEFTRHTIVAPYNNIKKVKDLVKKHKKDIAAVIVEPVAGNMGVALPKAGFLEELRRATYRYNIVLIFDEVITGFRLSFGGAQEIFGIKPDLTCLGKVMGAGLPCGAFGGRNEIMKLLAPEGGVYQAGTFSGNPITVSAALANLKLLSKNPPYRYIAELTENLCERIRQIAKDYRIKLKINYIGSMFSIFFTDKEVLDYNTAKSQNIDLFKRFYRGLLKEGIYFSPSYLEADFLSIAHTDYDLEKTSKAVSKVLRKLRR